MTIDAEKLEQELKEMGALEWQDELKKELKNQSDRGVAIVCASILDAQLEEILLAFLVEHKKVKKDLFNTSEPLSTFSSKIKMSYYLGLITEDEYKNIEILRKIRNDFAHRLSGISFEDPSVNSRCGILYIPVKQYFPENMDDVPLPNEDGSIPKLTLDPFLKDLSPRDKFVQVFKYLSLNFYERSGKIKSSKREKLEIRTTRADFFREMANDYLNNKRRLHALAEELNQKRQASGGEIIDVVPTETEKLLDQVTELYFYLAEVLENSYTD